MQPLEQLSPRHIAIMRMLVLEGAKPMDVAKHFGIPSSSLSVMRSRASWIEREAEMVKEVFKIHRKSLDRLVKPAIKALEDTVKSEKESMRLKSAIQILDRTGFPAGIRVEMESSPVFNMYIPFGWKDDERQAQLEEVIDGEVIEHEQDKL